MRLEAFVQCMPHLFAESFLRCREANKNRQIQRLQVSADGCLEAWIGRWEVIQCVIDEVVYGNRKASPHSFIHRFQALSYLLMILVLHGFIK